MGPQGSQSQPILVETEEFLARLTEEVTRSDRYEHSFALLILRPPFEGGESPPAAWLESLATGLIRGCDIVSVFANEGAVLVLLPETGVAGANALLERFRNAIGDTDNEWQAMLLEYPTNREAIAELLTEAQAA